jgi:hypothetical protein
MVKLSNFHDMPHATHEVCGATWHREHDERSDDMPETTSSGLGEKARSLFDDSTSAAQNVAGKTATATGQTLSQGMESALDGMQQIRRKLEGAAQGLPSAPTSSRLAWRAGRWLGRVEGVIWLGSKGLGIWWRRTRKKM